jgi:hypothetical protein
MSMPKLPDKEGIAEPREAAEEPNELTADELIRATLDDQSQKRLWLRTITPLLQLRSHDSDPSGRVQLAFDLMHIAACERASRLLRSDLPSESD